MLWIVRYGAALLEVHRPHSLPHHLELAFCRRNFVHKSSFASTVVPRVSQVPQNLWTGDHGDDNNDGEAQEIVFKRLDEDRIDLALQ